MKRLFCLVLIFSVVAVALFAAETKEFPVTFDTRKYTPFYVEFGFRKDASQIISNGEVAFSSMTLEEGQASAELQLEVYWSIISSESFDLSLEIGSLANGEGEARKELPWTLNFGDKVLSSDGNANGVIHNHQGQQFTLDTDSVPLRGYVNVGYGSEEFKSMALDKYRGTLTLKVTAVGE